MAQRDGVGKEAQGVQSVEIGFKVLSALAGLERAGSLKDIAQAAGLSPSKTHRYLVSLVRAGVVVQYQEGGAYDLGKEALNIGLSALNRIDGQRLAADGMEALHAKVGNTLALLVWGNRGATIIRCKERSQAVTVNGRPGYVLPTITSASGRVFAAFLDEELVAPFIFTDFQNGLRPHHHGVALDDIGFRRLLDQVRQQYVAVLKGDLIPGIDAISAPIFNHDGSPVFVLALWGASALLNVDVGGVAYAELITAAAKISRELGYKGHYPEPARAKDDNKKARKPSRLHADLPR